MDETSVRRKKKYESIDHLNFSDMKILFSTCQATLRKEMVSQPFRLELANSIEHLSVTPRLELGWEAGS